LRHADVAATASSYQTGIQTMGDASQNVYNVSQQVRSRLG
jgi:hypothetical protein